MSEERQAITVGRIERQPPPPVPVRPNYTPTTFQEAIQWAQLMAKSTMVPTDYRGRPENILLAMQLGNELGLSPLQAVQSIATINGKPSIYGDAALGLVRSSGLCEDVIETMEGEGDSTLARCVAIRKGAEPVVRTFSVADARKASLWGKSGPWTQYPTRMLMWRARGFALRDAFPDVLRGLITREEAIDLPRDDWQEVRPAVTDLTGDLDAFAGEAQLNADPHLTQLAASKAREGVEVFRAFWTGLSDTDRDMLRPHLRTYQAEAEQSDRERASVSSSDRPTNETAKSYEPEDPFDLPPIEQRAEDPPVEPAASEPAATSTGASLGPSSTGEGGNPLFVPAPKAGAKLSEWAYWERQLEALCQGQTQQGLANVKAANRITIEGLKADGQHDRYARALALVDGRTPS